MNKPLALQIEELKRNIIDIINNSNIPIVITDYVIKDLYNEIHTVSQTQLINDTKEYEKSLKDSESATSSHNEAKNSELN